MFILGNFLVAIGTIMNMSINLVMFIIIAHTLLSWVNPDPNNIIIKILNDISFPILSKVRGVVYRFKIFSTIPLDVSPIVTIMILIFCKIFIIQSIIQYGSKLK